MSISSCFFLLLLFLSLHACHARRLAAAGHNKFQISNQISNQNGEKRISAGEKVESPSSTNKTRAAKGDNQNYEMGENSEKLKELNAKEKVVEKDSKVSVPWKVPHKKRGEKHPGFNLDYSPPKTHPPSHN